MKTLAKYLLPVITLFAACNTTPKVDPNIAIKENARKAILAYNVDYFKNDTAGAKIDTVILVKLDTLLNKQATQYLKENIQKKYELYDKLYKATSNLIDAQKDMHKWVSKDMRKGTVVDESDNVKQNAELKTKLDHMQAMMDSCDKVIAGTANDTVGYYAHSIITYTKNGKKITDTTAQQLTKDLQVVKPKI